MKKLVLMSLTMLTVTASYGAGKFVSGVTTPEAFCGKIVDGGRCPKGFARVAATSRTEYKTQAHTVTVSGKPSRTIWKAKHVGGRPVRYPVHIAGTLPKTTTTTKQIPFQVHQSVCAKEAYTGGRCPKGLVKVHGKATRKF